MNFNSLNLRIIAYLVFAFVCIALPWIFFCFFLQNFSFVMWDEKSEYIENIGYFGSFLGGTLGVLLTAGSLFFLAITLNFERKKANQENFDNKFFLMLERLENIKDKINEDIKNKILNEINEVEELSVEKTLEESKKVIHKYNSEIGHYYRMLFQILKMIDQNKDKISDFRNVSVTYYTNILRSTLDFKLTQILAINTYCSDSFDGEYEDYLEYVRKYNFFEHMPFCISKNYISEALLSVLISSERGFGNSSFLKKINPYVLSSIKKSMNIGYEYDLMYLFLKRLAGTWIYEDKLKFSIDLRTRKILIGFQGEEITIDLLNSKPESEKICKCMMFNEHLYTISSYFNESLDLIIEYKDKMKDFECSNSDLNDMKEIKFTWSSCGLNNLKCKFECEYMHHDYEINFNELMTKIN
ncbi:putative phage abortive infection protein [Acinetobacter haemolyticus]|uniref:putative phage abortive infection protein n=1 Tax=Acinetobacter haemolyticus TaxID=29430 RepID=UPI003AF4B389